MEFNAFKQAVIAAANDMGITAYELYYQSAESTSISAYKRETDKFTSSMEGGVCFRCIVNGKMGYASTEELSEAQAVSIVRRAADNAAVLESDDPVFLVEGGQTYAAMDYSPYALPTTDEMISTVLAGQEAIYAADEAIIDGSSNQVFGEKGEIAIANSNGLDLHYAYTTTGFMVGAVVSDGKEMANSYELKLGELSKLDLKEVSEKTAKSAKAKLGGDVAPTGVYPVVFSPDAMASLLSTYSSVFSSESAQKGLSRLNGKEGEVIAADIITLVDDPFYKESAMPINFDAEGSPAGCKNVIENGKLNTLLYNLKTAAIAGKKTTGNAAKSGYNGKVGIQPFTMYIAPGAITEEELLAKAGNGVYINSLGGLHAGANVISGDFSLQSGGFMIENGQKTTPVKSFTVAGNFYDLLKQITAVASNVELPHASGITNFGSPSVLAEGLSIAGK
ncbi:MAG: TldD/PmbA family protein [Clostridia bacterium]|nr:TldD/PmbA family protein [Clostridia bacterium]